MAVSHILVVMALWKKVPNSKGGGVNQQILRKGGPNNVGFAEKIKKFTKALPPLYSTTESILTFEEACRD